ncbi:MAG: hypothetical protein WDZ76_05845 [Pseudohongiellaceae bacterium]
MNRRNGWSSVTGVRGAVIGFILAGLLVTGGAVFAGWFFYCPCDFTPGGYLLGERVDQPVDDWSFANDVPLCQIQVSALLPHSVNLNCMATASGELYLSCSQCEGKRWSGVALDNGEGRIRIDGRVYPVMVSHITDAAQKDRAWQARLEKLQHFDVPGSGSPLGTPRPSDEQWWTFRVVSTVD